ncbi:hypothetical protein TNCV_1436721 [Trichonephila clavipes]|nr:hypothetical protein TNCV_1436721 [Trichonephila clavipes]
MGLRTVLQSGCPKDNAYSTPHSLITTSRELLDLQNWNLEVLKLWSVDSWVPQRLSRKSAKDNRVPMHMCTPKYSKVMSSVIAPATFDCEKTPLRPRAGCNSMIKGSPLLSQDPGESRKGSPLENTEEKGWGLLPLKHHILNPNEITNILNNFKISMRPDRQPLAKYGSKNITIIRV